MYLTPAPSPSPPTQPTESRNIEEAGRYLQLIPGLVSDDRGDSGKVEEIKTTPLFTQNLRTSLDTIPGLAAGCADRHLHQYGLLGIRDATYNARYSDACETLPAEQNLVFANMNAPWSTFICGSQGAGKSHTLSVLLENSLLASSAAGRNPNPLAGIVFHYDNFTGYESTQLCEAAWLCSAGIPVRVLVSPSNLHAMRKLYRKLPGLTKEAPRPEVVPLYFQQHHLNVSRIMTLMAVSENGTVPLYIEVLFKILRDMSMQFRGANGLDYLDFKERLAHQGFTKEQKGPLKMRLALLESFLAHNEQSAQSAARLSTMFSSAQGTLTIVDLSCPFVNENDACALFSICLSIFMEGRGSGGRVIALDEAHKVSTASLRSAPGWLVAQ